MTENSFESQVEALLNGEIKEIIVEKDEFFSFRDVWNSHPDKKQIVGEAGLGGKVIYRKQG